MLRPAMTTPNVESGGDWRVSSGSAAVLGLCEARLDVAPTTAYIMLGVRCRRDCAFCSQARSSRSDPDLLSRVRWSAYSSDEVRARIAERYADGAIRRLCFQVTSQADDVQQAAAAIRAARAASPLPICVSVASGRIGDVGRLLDAGAERVTISLDAATPRLYARLKGGSWHEARALLEAAALRWAGAIGTHLIAGLGETERELVECWHWLFVRGIHTGLFAFTPVPGTAMASSPAPALSSYRRIQAARWVLIQGDVKLDDLQYTDAGALAGLGLPASRLAVLLAGGDAFRTAGCPGCNRPYYNERPGGDTYNYARPLTADESSREIAPLLRELCPSVDGG